MSNTGFNSGGLYWNHLRVAAMDHLEAAFDDLLAPLPMSLKSYPEKSPGNAYKFSIKRIFVWSSAKKRNSDSASSKTLENPVSEISLVKTDTMPVPTMMPIPEPAIPSSVSVIRTVAKVAPKAELERLGVLLDGLQTAAKVLDALSGAVPFPPAKAVIGIGIKVISLFKDANHAHIESLELCNRIASYVLLVAEEVKGKEIVDSPELGEDLTSFNQTLASLYDKLAQGVPSDQNAILAAVDSSSHLALIQACEIELQRQIEHFQVLRTIHSGKTLSSVLTRVNDNFHLSVEINERVRSLGYTFDAKLEEVKDLIQHGRIRQKQNTETMPSTSNLIGRDHFISQVVTTLTSSRNVCMLGQEGMGRTSIAAQIMNDDKIASTFSDGSRYWVPCSRATTFSKFEDLLCSQIQTNSKLGNASRMTGLLRFLSVTPNRKLILLDDFETTWKENEAACKRALTGLIRNANVTVLLTMNSDKLPEEFDSHFRWFDEGLTPLEDVPISPSSDAASAMPPYPLLNSWVPYPILPLERRAAEQLFGSYFALTDTPQEKEHLDALLDKLQGRPSLIKLVAIRGVNSATADIKSMLDELKDTKDPMSFIIEDSITRLHRIPNSQKILNTLALFPTGLDGKQLDIWLAFRNSEAMGYLRGIGLVSFNSSTKRWSLSPIIRSRLPPADPVAVVARREAHQTMLSILQRNSPVRHGPKHSSFKIHMADLTKHEPGLNELLLNMVDQLDTNPGYLQELNGDGKEEDAALQTRILDSLKTYSNYQSWSRANKEVAKAAVRLAEKWKSPPLPSIHYSLGTTLLQLDQYSEARKYLDLAMEGFILKQDRFGIVRSATQSIKARCSMGSDSNENLLVDLDKLASRSDLKLPVVSNLDEARSKYAQPNDEAKATARIHSTKAHLYRCLKKPELALKHAEIALYLARDLLKNSQLAADCQYIKARALALSGRFAEAVNEADKVIAFYEGMGIQGRGTGSGAFIYNVKTRALKGAQRWGPSLFETAKHAVTMCQSYGSPMAAGEALMEYGELFVTAEKWEEATLIFEEASKEFRRVDTHSGRKVTQICNQNLVYARAKADLAKVQYTTPSRA
ncbi:hypothetical protein CVT24_000599 [Panaeolus cyanescens]|uniref:NB-ARC domain-containing protein n=1 Tax=Panaeolus cyanescens TaxID=181874 RepID=A0A409YDH3_9AGAR|nr:hypothetical protein CVT24_000599 [Panaeolus cyanescens]